MNTADFSIHPLDKDYEYLKLWNASPQVVIVVLDRSRKRNAINSVMWKNLGDAFSKLGRGDDCRAILLAGDGASFCAGIDVSDSAFLPSSSDNADVARVGLTFLPKLQEMQACFTALEDCPVPVIVAVHGNCIGAGIDLVCCADIRLCSSDAVFSVREVALGLAADVGTLQRLPKIVGNQSIVRELCLTGRDFTAEEAADMGFVSRICQYPFQEALQICTSIARHSPVAVQGTKKALLYARDHSVKDGLEQIASYNIMSLQGRDLEKAWTARASKKEPRFSRIPPHSKL